MDEEKELEKNGILERRYGRSKGLSVPSAKVPSGSVSMGPHSKGLVTDQGGT